MENGRRIDRAITGVQETHVHIAISNGELQSGKTQPRRITPRAIRPAPAKLIPAAQALRIAGAVVCAPLLPLLMVLACLALAFAVYLRCIAALCQLAWHGLGQAARRPPRHGKRVIIIPRH
jgi:hypothetical protein